MADDYEDNDFEEDFQEADEPDDLNDDLEAADGDQEQIDVLPAGIFSNFDLISPNYLEKGFWFLKNLFKIQNSSNRQIDSYTPSRSTT